MFSPQSRAERKAKTCALALFSLRGACRRGVGPRVNETEVGPPEIRIIHITPNAVANALVVGLWLALLALRTGSVWPGVVSHAFINGSWNIWQIGKVLGVFPPIPSVVVTVSVVAVVLASFLASIRLLAQRRLPDDSPPVEAREPMGIQVS
jgi:hypothetical protein